MKTIKREKRGERTPDDGGDKEVEEEVEERVTRLLDMFPQILREELLEVSATSGPRSNPETLIRNGTCPPSCL